MRITNLCIDPQCLQKRDTWRAVYSTPDSEGKRTYTRTTAGTSGTVSVIPYDNRKSLTAGEYVTVAQMETTSTEPFLVVGTIISQDSTTIVFKETPDASGNVTSSVWVPEEGLRLLRSAFYTMSDWTLMVEHGIPTFWDGNTQPL
jgi:hypothetical protein